MCGNCNHSCSKSYSAMHWIAKVLVIVGGINWGLVGVGMFYGKDWNLVSMLLGSMPTLEAVVYILVGVAAVLMLFSCKCRNCCSAPIEDMPKPQI